MMKIGLNDGPTTSLPSLSLPKTWVDSPLSTADPIWSWTSAQMSTTLL